MDWPTAFTIVGATWGVATPVTAAVVRSIIANMKREFDAAQLALIDQRFAHFHEGMQRMEKSVNGVCAMMRRKGET